MAIEGISFDVADTKENLKQFGRVGSGPKASAFPKLQVMALAECGSHAVTGAVFGTARTGERTLAGNADLLDKVELGMLVTADAGLYSWELFNAYANIGADLAWRIEASVSVGHIRWHSDGSYLALIFRSGLAAQRRARLVALSRAGGQVPEHLTRPEESAIGETKTDLRGRGQVLRSKTPELVEQQMWGLLLAHYAIRALICEAADEAGYDPDRLSFIHGLRVVRRQVTDQAAISP